MEVARLKHYEWVTNCREPHQIFTYKMSRKQVDVHKFEQRMEQKYILFIFYFSYYFVTLPKH